MVLHIVYNLQHKYTRINFVTLTPKLCFDWDIKRKLKILSLEIDSAYHTECSTKAICNGCGLFCAATLLVMFVFQYATCVKDVSLRFFEVHEFTAKDLC